MQHRSRAGCIDCRRAKIKCDEAAPTCGTCQRRGKRCQGYSNVRTDNATSSEAISKSRNRVRSESGSTQSNSPPQTEHLTPGNIEELPEDESTKEDGTTAAVRLELTRSNQLAIAEISPLPLGDCSPEDRLGLSMYFNRHPHELVMGSEPEFVKDMNMHFLAVFQQSPEATRDVLCGIGQVYLHRMGQSLSLVRALDKRARALARIRSRNELPENMDLTLAIILGICGSELIDTNGQPGDFSLQILYSTAAVLVNQFLSTGSALSVTSKYFLRGLARQEMMLAITQRRRPSMVSSMWLDAICYDTADRFMGFTMTFMPLLEELCGLAEDMKRNLPMFRTHPSQGQDSLEGAILYSRAAALRTRLESWRPPYVSSFSGSSSQKFFLHATTYRSAAILYLHRLLYHPGQSQEADDVALSLAYDIFAHLTGPFSWLRLSLLPTLVAACELKREDDRSLALEIFEGMYSSRNTSTTETTKTFVVHRVWPSVDASEGVSWMELADRYPGECVPI